MGCSVSVFGKTADKNKAAEEYPNLGKLNAETVDLILSFVQDTPRSLRGSFAPSGHHRNLIIGLDRENLSAIAIAEVPNSPFVAVARSVEKDHSELLSVFVVSIFIMMFLALICAMAFGVAAAQDVLRPLELIGRVSSAVGKGDLRRTVLLARHDELGELALDVSVMVANLRDLLIATSMAAYRLGEASNYISSGIQSIGKGSVDQDTATKTARKYVEEIATTSEAVSASLSELTKDVGVSRSAIETLSTRANNLADSGKILDAVAEETSSSINKISATMNQVVETMDDLSGHTESFGKAIQKMRSAFLHIDKHATQSASVAHQTVAQAAQGAEDIKAALAGSDDLAAQTTASLP